MAEAERKLAEERAEAKRKAEEKARAAARKDPLNKFFVQVRDQLSSILKRKCQRKY